LGKENHLKLGMEYRGFLQANQEQYTLKPMGQIPVKERTILKGEHPNPYS